MDKLNEMPKKNKKTNHIFRSDSFYNTLKEITESENGVKIIRSLETKKYALKNEIPYRVLNHWENKNLFESYRTSDKGWRRYSIIDNIWIDIINRLRNFGFPLKKIYTIGKDLGLLGEDKKSTRKHLLHFYYIYLKILECDLLYIIFFDNGEADILTYKEYRYHIEFYGMADHLIIILNELLDLPTDYKSLKPLFHSSMDITHEEYELIELIRSDYYKNIKIETKHSQIMNIEAKKNTDPKTRINTLIKKNPFSDITLKIRDEEVVHIEETIKKKYKQWKIPMLDKEIKLTGGWPEA